MLFFDAKVSLRDQRLLLLLEPAVMFALIMLYIWRLRVAHQPWAALAIFCMMLMSHYRRGESPGDLGFCKSNFRACVRVFSPALLFISLTLLAAGILVQTLRGLELERAVLGFMAYCVWGLFQQYLLNAYFVNRLLAGSANPAHAATLGAACFSCAHAPNWFLMIVGFAAGYCAARVWIRYRNLWFLGLAHGAIGLMLYLVVPDSISHHLAVGPGWFGK